MLLAKGKGRGGRCGWNQHAALVSLSPGQSPVVIVILKGSREVACRYTKGERQEFLRWSKWCVSGKEGASRSVSADLDGCQPKRVSLTGDYWAKLRLVNFIINSDLPAR